MLTCVFGWLWRGVARGMLVDDAACTALLQGSRSPTTQFEGPAAAASSGIIPPQRDGRCQASDAVATAVVLATVRQLLLGAHGEPCFGPAWQRGALRTCCPDCDKHFHTGCASEHGRVGGEEEACACSIPMPVLTASQLARQLPMRPSPSSAPSAPYSLPQTFCHWCVLPVCSKASSTAEFGSVQLRWCLCVLVRAGCGATCLELWCTRCTDSVSSVTGVSFRPEIACGITIVLQSDWVIFVGALYFARVFTVVKVRGRVPLSRGHRALTECVAPRSTCKGHKYCGIPCLKVRLCYSCRYAMLCGRLASSPSTHIDRRRPAVLACPVHHRVRHGLVPCRNFRGRQ